MAGELFEGVVQFGKQTVSGTTVPATRKMYYMEPVLTFERAPRPKSFMVQSRQDVRGVTAGPKVVGGSLRQDVSSEEMVELLLMGVQGAVTPSTPAMATNTRDWEFTPSSTLDMVTVEWDDGAREWEANTVHANQLTIAGDVDGENTITAELFGLDMVTAALTGALSDRTPVYHEGWEAQLYIDAFGAAPFTTAMPDLMKSWNIVYNNNLGRKYLANNTLAQKRSVPAPITVTASITIEASEAQAATEFANWNQAGANPTKRVLGFEFGNNETIETTFKRRVRVAIPGSWTAFDLGATDAGTRMYALSYQYVYDPTNAFGIKYYLRNGRSTAY
jgi:hypothetical protein